MRKFIAALLMSAAFSTLCFAADSAYVQDQSAKAAKGSGAAAYNLALCYHDGTKDCPQSDTEAAKWLQFAASHNDVQAMVNLGDFFHQGVGMPKDDAAALKWYRSAVMFGNADAEFNIGTFYANGYGVTADPKEAAKWYLRAANQGLIDAQMALASQYMQAQPPDYADAYFWSAVAGKGKSDDAAQAKVFADRVGKALSNDEFSATDKKVQAWRATPEAETYNPRAGKP